MTIETQHLSQRVGYLQALRELESKIFWAVGCDPRQERVGWFEEKVGWIEVLKWIDEMRKP